MSNTKNIQTTCTKACTCNCKPNECRCKQHNCQCGCVTIKR
ncbi:MAG: hypothetical protein JWP63_3435 [Candidatus Solibacter sp.]|nr:hypothetical protein [Candidatus Solibacter sp.]